MTHLRRILLLVPPLLFCGRVPAQTDPEVVQRIVHEGRDNSHVWRTLLHLAEGIGPRLTGSTRLLYANMWTREEFSRLGLSNCHLFKWGEVPVGFDRGPSSVRVVLPEERALEFTAAAWSAGTDGPLRGPVLAMPTTRAELDALGERLSGAWILSESTRRRRPPSDESEADKAAREEREEVEKDVLTRPIAGRVIGSRNDLVVTGGSRNWRELSMDDLPRDVSVTIRRTDFEEIQGWLAAGREVELEVDLDHCFVAGPIPVFDTIAEIRGSELPEEVVILSAHLDSWDGPGSQGAQDNGTGSAVTIEAARILMAAGARPKRTIRFCLWTGEEQGLLGSLAYVEALSAEERARISAAFVDDGGTNYQGGLVCIESMKPMLDEALAPIVAAFPGYDVQNSIQEEMPKGGASDHASFNKAGIPGFFWMEKSLEGRDEKGYNFVHHTQHDTPAYAIEEYLVQSATTSAAVAYYLANAPTLLPREVEKVEEAEPEEPFDAVATPVSGRWEVGLVGDDAPDFTFQLELRVDAAGQVRGGTTSAMGTSKIKEGTWDPVEGQAVFVVKTPRGETTYHAKLVEGALLGTIQRGDRDPWSFRAERPAPLDAPLNGTWRATLLERGSEFRLHFEVLTDKSVTGWVKSSQTDSAIFDGRWDAEAQTVTFEYDYPHAGRLAVQAKLSGEKLTGTVGESAEFEAVREAGGQ